MKILFIIPVIIVTIVFAQQTENKIDDKKDADNKNTKTVEELSREMEDLKKRVDELEEKNVRESTKYKLNIKGFFDVNMSNYKKQPNIFDIGSFELQLEHVYPQNIQVAAALVFDKKGAHLGVGFIDYHLFGSSIAPRGRLFREKGIHLQVGKFDVPFGNDWQYFSAVDRISVTSPLTTSRIMDGGYNDVGARLILNMIWMNTSLHVLRGIEQGYSFGGNSFGGRFGFSPLNDPYSLTKKYAPFEIGFSYLYDVDKAGAPAEKMWAADFETNIGWLLVSSEYYYRDKMLGIRDKGYQATTALDFNTIPLILFTRYDDVLRERYKAVIESGEVSRISTGLRISIYDIAYIKAEYSRYIKREGIEKDDEYFVRNLYYLQLMIRF
jgi:hypothetical protein